MHTRIALTGEPAREAKRLANTGATEPYRGRRVTLVLTDRVTVTGTFWDGGSRSYWSALRPDGERWNVPTQSPWSGAEGTVVDLPSGMMLVERTIFCGKPGGLYLYVNPAATVLPLLTEGV